MEVCLSGGPGLWASWERGTLPSPLAWVSMLCVLGSVPGGVRLAALHCCTLWVVPLALVEAWV